MSEIHRYDTAQTVADVAAKSAIDILGLAIQTNGSAMWILAGGTSPILAYKKLVKDYADAINWSLVTVVIGDERLVPLEHSDSNWGTIIELFDNSPALSQVVHVRPDVTGTVEEAASSYDRQVKQLVMKKRFDLAWVGVGEDGHTLSLFPDNNAFTNPTNDLVIPVHDSPKPPAERLTLSLKALEYVSVLVIFAVGASKKEILSEVRLGGKLPITIVVEAVESHDGEVLWLYDTAAWGEDS